jgi:hypothetical protein
MTCTLQDNDPGSNTTDLETVSKTLLLVIYISLLEPDTYLEAMQGRLLYNHF